MTQFTTAYTRLLNALDEHGIDTSKLKEDFAFYNANPFNPVDIMDPDFEAKARKFQSKMYATHVSKLSSQIHRPTFAMVDSLMSQKKESYWLITCKNDELHSLHDWPMYAKSTEMALAGIKDLLISNRIMLDDIRVADERISFFDNGECVISMQPMPFESSNESGRAQADACFKNLQDYQIDVAAKRLQKLPGLSQLPIIEYHPGAIDGEQGNALLPSIKTTVKIIKDSLDAEGIELPLSIAQEVTAKFLSGHTWQVLTAMSKKAESKCILPPVMLSEGEYREETRIRYYRTYADGVWAFAKEVEQKKLYPELYRSMLGSYTWRLNARAGVLPVRPKPLNYSQALAAQILNVDYVLETRELHELSIDDDLGDLDEFLGVVGEDVELTTRHLKELFYTELDSDEKIRAYNWNEGKPDFLRIKDWLFSIEIKRENPMLRVEKIGTDGLPVKGAKYLYIYKGEIKKTIDEKWELRADYSRNLIANLDGFSEAELQSLKDYSGLSSHFLN